ncbi:MAG: RNA polymerase sigma factor [Anaerolineae bacterium]
MATPKSDSALIAECLQGQESAWVALVERYRGLVYSIPLRAGLDADDAAEVFQAVFTLLLEHMASIRAPKALAAWLITTTRREVWRLLRARARERSSEEAAAQRAVAEQWRARVSFEEEAWADRALVREALQLIGERCRQLLTLLYGDADALSYEEIAARLRMPLGSIGPTRARCLEKMRMTLHSMGMGEA